MQSRSSAPERAFLEELRRRRAELLESMRAVEQALAAPGPGRQTRWAERVHVALVELSADVREHIDITEGPDDAISWLCSEARFVAGITGDRVRHEGHLVSPAANRPFGSAGGATRS